MRKEETPDCEENSASESMAVNPSAEQWMPIKLLGIKESDRLMDELRKENFDLKLRIYFLQDGWREKLDGVQTQLEQMEENIHDKETQIFIKDKLLSEKETEIKSLENKLEIACIRSKTLEQDLLDLNQKFSLVTNLGSPLLRNMDKQLEMKNNGTLAGISAPPHVGGDDTSPTETMGSGSNLHSKSLKAESHSKSNQEPFNEVVEYQTACSTPTSSRSLQLFLQNERSCLGEDSISLSQPKRGNSAPEIISSPSVFKDRSFQINLDLQQLLEVKTKENLLLRSKLGLLDHVGEIDPKFVPDVNQLKKEVGDLKTELNKASDTIAMLKQQISINMKNKVYTETQCKSELIMRMAMEIKKLRKNRLCGSFGSGEQASLTAREKENFSNNHDRHLNGRKEETLLKNEKTVRNNVDDTNNSAQRVKHLGNRITNKDMIISEQSKALDQYKNAYKMSRYPFKTSPPSINFTSNIYCGQKFTFYSEPKANFPCKEVVLKNQIAELKNRSELAIRKRQQQERVSKRLNKRRCSSHLPSFFAGSSSPMLAPQLIFSGKTEIKSPSNKSAYHLNGFTSQLNPLEIGCLNGNVSEVVTLLTQEVFMYASSFLHI